MWFFWNYRGLEFRPMVLFVLVLEGNFSDVVVIRARYWGSSLLGKVIELNRFRRFEHEHEHEYRDAEYGKTAIRPTKTPECPMEVKN